MIKVCFIVSGLGFSGAEVVLDRYLENNEFIDPYFIIIYDSNLVTQRYIERYGKEKVYSLNLIHNKNILRFIPWKDMSRIDSKMKMIINDINPDIIYANNTMETMLISKYIKKIDIPKIAHIHDMKNSIKSPIRKHITIKSLKYYDEIITVSNATKLQWNVEKMKVVYNGISSDYYVKNENMRHVKNITKIGYVGSISRRKGFDLLIDSINGILNLGIKVNIAYSNIEDIDLYNYIKDIEKKSKGNVKLLESLSYDQVIEFYDSIDLLLVPSRQDPLPTVVIEAMARGVIVIGNNIDGIPEMIINKNNLIMNISSTAIVEKINQISNMEYEELKNIQVNQINYCKLNFSSNIKKNKLNQILEERNRLKNE